MRLKEKINEIVFSILIAFFLIAIALIFIGIRCTTTSWTFVTIGIVVAIPLGILFWYQRVQSSKKKN